MNRAPGMLQAVCIIAIAMGALGFFVAGFGIAAPFVSKAIQNFVTASLPAGSPQAKQQEQLQREIKAVTDQWALVNYALFAVLFVVAGCLIVGGLKAFRLQPSGHRLLLIAFMLAIAFELVRLIPAIAMQPAINDIMQKYFADVANTGPPAARRVSLTVMKLMTTIGYVFGYVFAAVWLLIKLGFYGYGTYYLRKPQTRAAFEPAAEIDWSIDLRAAEQQETPEDSPPGG